MSTHEDCAYWGLTWHQCSRYHTRLARYHLRRSRHYADRAVQLADKAHRFAFIGGGLALLVLVLQVIKLIAAN